MCAVSNIGDDWTRKWPQNPVNPWPNQPIPRTPNETPGIAGSYGIVTRGELDALKKELEELKKLLMAAKEYDKATGQPECHMDEKVDLIKKIAALVGVNMDEVFK